MVLANLQIEQEQVHASLDQIGGMVSFSESPEGYNSLHMATHLHTQVQPVLTDQFHNLLHTGQTSYAWLSLGVLCGVSNGVFSPFPGALEGDFLHH